MKKIFFILLLFAFSFSSVAQQVFHKVRLYDECNLAWTYNQERFYKVLWKGMIEGKIKLYTDVSGEENMPTTPSDLYASIFNMIRDQYGYDAAYYELTYEKSYENMKSYEDSLSVLRPYFMSLTFETGEEMVSKNPEWLSLEINVAISYEYSFRFDEACQWLDMNKAYWVNPYNAKDSVLFSTALKEQRYRYAENGEFKKQICNYCDQLLQEPILFKGLSIKEANLSDLPNRPYYYTPKNRGYRNLVNTIMEAFYKGEIKGYTATYSRFLAVEMTVDDLMKGFYEPGDDYYQAQLGYDPYTSIKQMLSEADMISVGSKMTLDNGVVTEKPYLFSVCFSEGHPSNYRGEILPLISFRYEDVIKVLENSTLIWYAVDNYADSCKFSEALKQERIYWQSFTVFDKEQNYIANYKYDSDSAKIKIQTPDNQCTPGIANQFSTHAEKVIRTSIAKTSYPSNTAIPLYKRYESVRNFNALEDDTLIRSTLMKMSEYFIKQGRSGNLTMYASDSLKRKLTNEELIQRMMMIDVSYYDEDGNLVEAYDTVNSRDLCSVNVYVTMELNAKGKVVITDRYVQLCLPAQSSAKGIEIFVVNFSYKEAEAFMKKDKEGKAYLKVLQSTRTGKDYEWVYDRYGILAYDYWDEDLRKTKYESLPVAIQKYFRY